MVTSEFSAQFFGHSLPKHINQILMPTALYGKNGKASTRRSSGGRATTKALRMLYICWKIV